MNPAGVFLLALCLFPGVVVFVELFLRLGFLRRSRELMAGLHKSFGIVRSSRISDHWKERVVPVYALRSLRLTLGLFLTLLLMLGGFFLAYLAAGRLLLGPFDKLLMLSTSLETLVITIAEGSLYAALRKKLEKGEGGKGESDYTGFEKALHHIALQSGVTREMALNLDRALAPRILEGDTSPPAETLYIAGLARAGTTVILEALHSTGAFASLTYRDMPFVTAPAIWRRLNPRRVAATEKKERAHGDRLKVNLDSPEAFEEVFWLTMAGEDYLGENELLPHRATAEVVEKYRAFTGSVCGSRPPRRPYLAKNNNNVLRIASLLEAFPGAIIIVPFRNPLDHAHSLLRQHRRFLARHREDPFALKYMNWLGHFEFGSNFRPFAVGRDVLPSSMDELLEPAYWLRYWEAVYSFLIENHGAEVHFLDYDELCRRPGEVLSALALLAGLEESALSAYAGYILPAHAYSRAADTVQPASEQQKLHKRLRSLAFHVPGEQKQSPEDR